MMLSTSAAYTTGAPEPEGAPRDCATISAGPRPNANTPASLRAKEAVMEGWNRSNRLYRFMSIDPVPESGEKSRKCHTLGRVFDGCRGFWTAVENVTTVVPRLLLRDLRRHGSRRAHRRRTAGSGPEARARKPGDGRLRCGRNARAARRPVGDEVRGARE